MHGRSRKESEPEATEETLLAMLNPSVMASVNYVFIMALVIGCITAKKVIKCTCCCVVAIKLHSQKTLGKRKNIGKTTRGEINMARNVRATHNEHLCDPEVAAEYLTDALEEGDASVILMALRNIAEAQEGGITGLAMRSDLGRESMYKMLSSTGNPKLVNFTKLIQGLGLKLTVEQDPHYHASI
jgi:probable addiction module antidote protein